MRRRLFYVVIVLCGGLQPSLAQPGSGGLPPRSSTEPTLTPQEIPPSLGRARIPDRATFEALSYQGPEVMRDQYLADLEFVKFVIQRPASGTPRVYWMNTERFRAHPHFMREVGLGGRELMRGAVTYLPRLRAADGSLGRYLFDFQPRDRFTFEDVQLAYRLLVETMPPLEGKLAFHPLEGNLSLYRQEQARYEAAPLPVHLDEDIYQDIGFLPLNLGVSYGRLRMLENEIHPAPRDIVICRSLPQELPRIAGVLSLVRQTPLSHVNLRAVQDQVPNAFVANALSQSKVRSLLGKWVRYQVTPDGYHLREATAEEVNAHFLAIRPKTSWDPTLDLSAHQILPLTDIGFPDAAAFGVKTANLAAMHKFDFPAGTLPNGYGVPFYFYDSFMRYNGFYQLVEDLLGSREFRKETATQQRELKQLRSLIRQGKLPPEMRRALTHVQQAFPPGISIRCRSSTNNEDLPAFSGAGLYESYTHHPQEGHLAKSIKQVYSSLWTFRAFEQREFYRVDHLRVAMGVLLHPNFSKERANGVAVTDDILYGSEGNYYINTQVGEDLVTNPSAEAVAEEVLLGWWKQDGHEMIRESAPGERLLTSAQLDELRQRLARIHARFRDHYGKTDDDRFAVEIEFKITAAGRLVIKQARPWVF